MKEKLAGNRIYLRGFNTLEIIIALALMMIVIVGAVNANISAQYWTIASQTSNEALYKAKTLIEQLRATGTADFQNASATPLTRSEDENDDSDDACIGGGLCYFIQKNVTDISSCSKFVEGYVEWRISLRYPTSTESLYTNLTNNNEIIALSGDCALNVPQGNWVSDTPEDVGELTFPVGRFLTSIDALQGKVYVTSSTSPQLRVYEIPAGVGSNPTALGSVNSNASTTLARRLNAVDAVRDLATGRTYVFATQHSPTTQLVVFDVTDATSPTIVTSRTLHSVSNTGSFPQGWRLFAYGGRLYVTTRETSGPELHIFNISIPTQPTEIIGARTELTRTVNDMVVREQLIGGTIHRYLFLAEDPGASPYTKHLRIFEVTGDTPAEIVSPTLAGNVEARSIFLNGNNVYVGLANNSSGPELFIFNILDLLAGNETPRATSEVGDDVNTIRVSGKMMFLGTGESGEEFQVWKNDMGTWSIVSSLNVPRLAPLGIDFADNWVYLLTQSLTQTELLKVVYTP